MNPLKKFLCMLTVIVLALPGWALSQAEPAVKNKVPDINQTDRVGGSPSAGSSGYQQNYLNLGKECGMYLSEEWSPGIIVLKDGTVISDRMIRYNIFNQQMEYAVGGDTAAIGNPEELARLELDNGVFVYRNFLCNNEVKQGYLELLVKGDYELLLHRGIKYIYEESDAGTAASGPVTRYYQDDRYFLSCKGKIAEPLPDKKNEILSMIDKDQKKLKQYVKENKCKLKDQDEITDFFVFVNNN